MEKTTKQKIGLATFWIGAIWAFFWGGIIGWFISSAFHKFTMDEISQTVWSLSGPWFILWGLFGATLGALVAGIGILLYSGAKGSTVLKFGIGIFLTLIIGTMFGSFGHFPPFFGIGGILILLFFFGILWLWAKERKSLSGAPAAAADLKLFGYVFMLIAAWFVCGIASIPFPKALEGITPTSPIHVMIFFVLGWLFLFLGHYKSRKQ